jgi:hypothetical protein
MAEALKEKYPEVMFDAIKKEFGGSDKVEIKYDKGSRINPPSVKVNNNVRAQGNAAGGLKLHGSWFALSQIFPQVADLIKDGKISGMKIYADTPEGAKIVTLYIPYESVFQVLLALGINLVFQYNPADNSTTLFNTTRKGFNARVSISFSEDPYHSLTIPLEHRLRWDFDVRSGEVKSERLFTTFVSRKEDNNGKSEIDVPIGYKISEKEIKEYLNSDEKYAYWIGWPKPLYIGVVPFDLQYLLNSTIDKENEAFRRNIESTLKLIGLKNANLEEVKGAIYFPALITERRNEKQFVVLFPFDFRDSNGFLTRQLKIEIDNFSRDITNLFAYKIKKEDGKYYTFKCVQKDFQPRA